MKEKRVLVNEAKGNEFCEASGFPLNVPEEQELVHPMRRSFNMSVHQCRGGAYAALVRSSDYLLPLFRSQLVAGENVTDFIIEDLGRRAGEGIESIVTQHL